MNITDLQLDRLYQLNEQGKGPFLRQTKHLEETSELAEAVYGEHSPTKIASEAIDGLLMLLSIAADYASQDELPQQLIEAIDCSVAVFPTATINTTVLQRIGLGFATLSYIGTLQYISSAVQRYEGVASSAYKVSANPTIILFAITTSIVRLSTVLAHIVLMDLNLDLQKIYNEKMDKWEKVSK